MVYQFLDKDPDAVDRSIIKRTIEGALAQIQKKEGRNQIQFVGSMQFVIIICVISTLCMMVTVLLFILIFCRQKVTNQVEYMSKPH